MPSGIVVAASPKLWIRSASRADAAGGDVDRHLCQRGQTEDCEGKAHRAKALPRPFDAGVDQAVAMTVAVMVVVPSVVPVLAIKRYSILLAQ